jgi:hypothetical protein
MTEIEIKVFVITILILFLPPYCHRCKRADHYYITVNVVTHSRISWLSCATAFKHKSLAIDALCCDFQERNLSK